MTTPPAAPPAGQPGVKPPMDKRKKQLIIGGIAIAAVIGFALWRGHKSAPAPAQGGGSAPRIYDGTGGQGADYSQQLRMLQEELARLTAQQNPPPSSGGSNDDGDGPGDRRHRKR